MVESFSTYSVDRDVSGPEGGAHVIGTIPVSSSLATSERVSISSSLPTISGAHSASAVASPQVTRPDRFSSTLATNLGAHTSRPGGAARLELAGERVAFSSSLPTISGAHSSSVVAYPKAYSIRSDTCGMLNPIAKIFEPHSLEGVSVCHDTAGITLDPQATIFSPCSSKGTRRGPDGDLLYTIDGRGEVPSISVYSSCLEGTCSCTHYIGGVTAQLRPCRFASFISGPTNVLGGRPEESDFLWEGVTRGFKIVDSGCDTSYSCKNYKTILEGPFYEEMCELVNQEARDSLVTKVNARPRCVNAMGGGRGWRNPMVN